MIAVARKATAFCLLESGLISIKPSPLSLNTWALRVKKLSWLVISWEKNRTGKIRHASFGADAKNMKGEVAHVCIHCVYLDLFTILFYFFYIYAKTHITMFHKQDLKGYKCVQKEL